MRIAIVNDLPMAIEAMRRVLLDGGHHVAWVARDGAAAVEACIRNRPDLILMDLIMPKLDGVEATRQIMKHAPCGILVVTVDIMENQAQVLEAMGAGALDAVNTPVLQFADPCKGSEALLARIEALGRLLGRTEPQPRRSSPWRPKRNPECLVAIGASAGGPAALAYLLKRFPAEFPAPIVIMQHVDPQFAPGLASWLGRQTSLAVRLASDGDLLEPGTALLAYGEYHLVMAGPGRLGYVREPFACSYRPSIDVFFKSIDRFWEARVVGVLLTGMGRDGAEGLRRLRTAGHHTIVQDRATSVVYGMPKAAVELGAASEILPLQQIPFRLARLAVRPTLESKSSIPDYV